MGSQIVRPALMAICVILPDRAGCVKSSRTLAAKFWNCRLIGVLHGHSTFQSSFLVHIGDFYRCDLPFLAAIGFNAVDRPARLVEAGPARPCSCSINTSLTAARFATRPSPKRITASRTVGRPRSRHPSRAELRLHEYAHRNA